MNTVYLVVVISFILYYLEDFNLSSNPLMKFILIFSFIARQVVLFLLVYSNLVYLNSIFWINHSYKGGNNKYLHGHVCVSEHAGKPKPYIPN